jgi:hypothetical protein
MFNVNVESVKAELGKRAIHSGVEQVGGTYALRKEVRLTTAIYAAKLSR